MNKVILLGRLTAEPSLKESANGLPTTTFSIAVNRNYDKNQTDFIQIVAWRQRAEFVCKHFGKGDQIIIIGSLQVKTWEDKDGNKRTTYEVLAEEVTFCGTKKHSESNSSSDAQNGLQSDGVIRRDRPQIEAIDDNQLPF